MFALGLLQPSSGSALESPPLTILSPGEDSEVTSPISLSAEVQPNPGGLIRIALVNRQGQEISRKLLRVDGENGLKGTTFTTELPFEIPTEQSKALLTLAILDETYQTTTIRSVEVLLKSDGNPNIQPQTSSEPWLKLHYPQPSETIEGGTLLIVGSVTPQSENPIIIELVTGENRVVGSAQLAVESPIQSKPFEITLKYNIETPTAKARLVVRQMLNPYGTTTNLDSLLIYLLP